MIWYLYIVGVLVASMAFSVSLSDFLSDWKKNAIMALTWPVSGAVVFGYMAVLYVAFWRNRRAEKRAQNYKRG